MNLDDLIIFKDTNLLVVNKPTGYSVHNDEDGRNLFDLFLPHLGLSKLFPVHRLDKETSGVQIFALNADTAKKYAQEFEGRTIKKIYRGILRGQIKDLSGQWTKPLTDKSEGRKNPQGVAQARVPAETHYEVVESNRFFSFVEFDLLTGRQHQIRKHAALANHHIVGDSRYGDVKYNSKIAEIYSEQRMFLHCLHLEILGGSFLAPEPEIFAKIMAGKN